MQTYGPVVSTSKSKTSLSRSDWWDVGLVVMQGNKVQYVKVRFGRILQLTVLNLQMKKPTCKCRTVIVVGSYQTSL